MTLTKPSNARSMTGQGHAAGENDRGSIKVELRTVNNRGFKCVSRLSDSLGALDSRIEALVRSRIHRGTVHLSVSWRRPAGDNETNIDTDVLKAYCLKVKEVQDAIGHFDTSIDLASLMTLPGVIRSAREERSEDESLWSAVREVIVAAIDNLNEMREAEGEHMAESLMVDCQDIERRVGVIAERAPQAADSYRNRLETKIRRLLAEHDLESQPIDLLREVQIYADRADVSEEITRLESHLKMFVRVLAGEGGEEGTREPTGRKLDFVIQEMFRETNTIGSKAADAAVSAEVVEIKCAIERMRELVQNLE